ncbi:hypothetical protein [uncultured Thiothrix sp.]|uniref:hypothetical protein n=1 Tax=uncultured Thiothrix sp. TaxID=223185 RepID=UPI00260BEFAD|nr:hypothetical protein [uncultured Thiothrix sp.]HMT94792.1 hypothetical protein [Thiolinea sp.]
MTYRIACKSKLVLSISSSVLLSFSLSACVDSENNGRITYKTANGSLVILDSAVPLLAPDTSKINAELAYDIPPPPEAILDKDIAERVDISRPRAATFGVQYIASGQADPSSSTGTCQAAPLTGASSISSAVNAAMNIWASQLNSPQRINVQVCWRPLSSASTLAQAGPTSYTSKVMNGVTLYAPTLIVNAIENTDREPQLSDITIAINSRTPPTAAGTATSWHLDPTTAPPANAYDLTSVLIHELGHGFGLASLGLVSTINDKQSLAT